MRKLIAVAVIGTVIVLALWALFFMPGNIPAKLGVDWPGPTPYACGGTHTYAPDGTLICTGGVP